MVRVPEEIAVDRDGLVLRRFRMHHAPAVLAAIERSHAELRPWMPWAAEPRTLESVQDFLGLAGAEAGSEETMGFGLFDAHGEVVGGFGLHARRGPGTLEIGYWVRSDRTGRGYATAAARALTSTALDCFPDVSRVEIRCDPANLASAAIPPKLGYRLDPETDDRGHLVWAVARADWEARRP